MKEKPFISIIIPAYNAETTLKRCVRSVLIQDYEEYEIIINQNNFYIFICLTVWTL